MSGSDHSEEPLFQEGYAEGYEAGYVIALGDVRASLLKLRGAVDVPYGADTSAEEETVPDLTTAAAEPADEVIRVAPDEVAQPDPATDAQKQRNRERAQRLGRSGRYLSPLALATPPIEDSVEVMLISEDPDGWWFFLTDSYPVADWRADIRWFAKEGSQFIEDLVIPMKVPTQAEINEHIRSGIAVTAEPVMQPGDMGDDGDFDDRG